MRLRLWFLILLLVACGPKGTKGTPPAPKPTTTIADVPPQGSDDLLPLWPAITHGTLPNGLQYYVMKHGEPKGRAMMWLAVDAGAIQEDDDQRGLAHFTEHMAFNGTKRFPKHELVDYLEKIGMDFGADLNAYTSFDETVYQLTVPTDDQQYMDKAFEILRDWAGDISFEPSEYEKERGVVLEEWRLGKGVGDRVYQKEMPVLLPGTRYPLREAIGLPETLKAAPRDAIVRFYQDWYRPDLMAVFVVGDVADEAALVEQVKATFGDLANPEKPRARTAGGFPAETETRVSLVTDKELSQQTVTVNNLVPHRPKASGRDFRRMTLEVLYGNILNERFASIGRKATAPFTGAGVAVDEYVRGIDAFTRAAYPKPGKLEEALRALLLEVHRVEKHGVTQTELDRARTEVASWFEQNASSSNTRDSGDIVDEMTRNFLQGEFMVGSKAEYELAKKFLPTYTVAELNRLGAEFGGEGNRVVLISGPDGQPLPTKERVLAIMAEVEQSAVDPWVDKAVPTTLMATKPAPGKVVSEKTIDSLGVTEWTLSNRVRVVVKPTKFDDDYIALSGRSPGGWAGTKSKRPWLERYADDIVALGGVGDLDDETLTKVLTGKQVSAATSIGEISEDVTAASNVRDLETMLQLLYLRMTAPRKDADVFGVWRENLAQQIADSKQLPDVIFQTELLEALWQKNPRRTIATADEIRALDQDQALAFYTERFSDASDFTFVIVGDVDLAKLKPLVETYLGGLPAKGRIDKEIDLNDQIVPGIVKKTWTNATEDQATVTMMFHGAETWSKDSERDVQILGDLVTLRLTQTLREELGGVYNVDASGTLVRFGRQQRSFTIGFGCAPQRVDELIKAVLTTLADFQKTGPTADELEKVKQVYLRERETSMQTNELWLGWLEEAYRWGDDPTIILDPSDRLARMTVANVKAAARRFTPKKNYFQAVRTK